MKQINSHDNAIDIYIVEEITGAYGIANVGTALAMNKEFATTHITSHEFGHCFGLLHTNTVNSIVETPTNCNIAGDEVCDTPIDPGLNSSNMSGCIYISGGGYSPSTSNIMSFTPANCMTNITNEQEIRMREFMASNSTLQQAISANSCSSPTITNYQINGGHDNVTYNTFDSFTVTPADYADLYQWSIVANPNDNCSNNTLPTITGGNNANSTYITISFGTCTGTFRLSCKALNSFGSVYYTEREIYVYDPYKDTNPCVGKFSISPNPVKNISHVTFKLDYPEIPCDDNIGNRTYPKIISIYDIYGNLVFTDSMNKMFKLNNTLLPNGLFFVKLQVAIKFCIVKQ